MASEIRVNTFKNRSGLGTVSINDSGASFSGVVTASSFSGDLTGNVTSSGVTTFTDLRVGTAVTANSSGVQVGAGKSIRLYGATSGYSEIVAAAGSASTTFTLPANGGSSGEYLQTNGSGGLSWAGVTTGKILQVVNATYATQTSNSTGTYQDTGLTASITPSSTSSKILILVSQNGCAKSTANTSMELRLLRDATQLTIIAAQAGATANTTYNDIGSCSTCYLDSPNTTASVTYKTQFRSVSAIASVRVQTSNILTSESTITLLEVAA